MAYDFPATPTTGQQYLGYTWDGAKWVGGFQAQGVSNATQFFDVAGLSTIDITVPTWAKGVQIVGNLFASGASQINSLRVSVDGTTFVQGTTDYMYMAGHHNSVTPFYYTTVGTQYSYMPLCNPGAPPDNTTVASSFTLEMHLTRIHGTQQLTFKIYEVDFSSAGSRNGQQNWTFGYCVPPVTGNAKALRIYSSAAWAANSWIRIEWLGDLAGLPNGVSIVDAPADGRSYMRNNNLWTSGGALGSHLTPAVNGASNLGSAALRWGTVYTSDLSLSNGIGDWTIVEGEADLFITNNKTGRRYKFVLSEVE